MTGSTPTALRWHGPDAGAVATPEGARLLVIPLRAAEEQVLVVVGEADISTADQLRDHLTDALAGQPPALRAELGGLEFCDLLGLDALHDAARAAAAAGVHLTLSGMSAQLA